MTRRLPAHVQPMLATLVAELDTLENIQSLTAMLR